MSCTREIVFFRCTVKVGQCKIITSFEQEAAGFLGSEFYSTTTGYTVISDGIRTVDVQETPFKYFHNYVDMWWAGATLLVGVVLVLFGWLKSCFAKHFTKGIWFSGIGTFLVVASLFWVAGYGDTAFYPSLLNPMDSLTIRNASSSEFTLRTMSYVSILIPFVIAYIVYVWHCMDKKKLTPESLESTDHKY